MKDPFRLSRKGVGKTPVDVTYHHGGDWVGQGAETKLVRGGVEEISLNPCFNQTI